jgi:hypothetical protein
VYQSINQSHHRESNAVQCHLFITPVVDQTLISRTGWGYKIFLGAISSELHMSVVDDEPAHQHWLTRSFIWREKYAIVKIL